MMPEGSPRHAAIAVSRRKIEMNTNKYTLFPLGCFVVNKMFALQGSSRKVLALPPKEGNSEAQVIYPRSHPSSSNT